jgi:hypothetical protein
LESYHHSSPSAPAPSSQQTHNSHSPIERAPPRTPFHGSGSDSGGQGRGSSSNSQPQSQPSYDFPYGEHSRNLPEKENLFFVCSPSEDHSSGFGHGYGYGSQPLGLDESQVEEEINSAKRIMKIAKDGLQRSSQRRLHNDNFLKHENTFLSNLQRR